MLKWRPLRSRSAILADYVLVPERDLRDEDDVGAARDAGVDGDPSGIPAHDLQDHYPLMAFRGRVQAVERVGRAGDGGVEPEGHDRGGEIVVDGLGDGHDGEAVGVQLFGDAERPVAADRDERREAQRVEPALGLVEQRRGQCPAPPPCPTFAVNLPRFAVPRIVPPR